MTSLASNAGRRNRLRLSTLFNLCLFAAAGVSGFSLPAVAQEAATRYLGILDTGGRGCVLKGEDIQITIVGTKVTGYWGSAAGRLSFSGEMAGSSFRIARTAKTTGNETTLFGEVVGDKVEARLFANVCKYRSVLLKQAAGLRYVGTWTVTSSEDGCGLAGRGMQIEILGSDVTGSRELLSGSGSVRYRGKLAGTSFAIEYRTKDGNLETIAGEVKGDLVEVSFQGTRCSYRATLKKADP